MADLFMSLDPGGDELFEAVQHSRTTKSAQLYDTTAAFSAFVDHGGNIPLYEACSALLAREIAAAMAAKNAQGTGAAQELHLLDLGCGNGQLLKPALAQVFSGESVEGAPLSVDTDTAVSITLVDASPVMLEEFGEGRDIAGVPSGAVTIRKVTATFSEFFGVSSSTGDAEVATPASEAAPEPYEYDLCVTSFAFHYSAVTERAALLRRLREVCRRVLIIEFDVPDLGSGREKFDRLWRRYVAGLAEYRSLPCFELVAGGFLWPSFVAACTEHGQQEVSAETWAGALRVAGFADVEVVDVFAYWWANCVCVIGT
jgi:SAM-dependent methyltransferase